MKHAALSSNGATRIRLPATRCGVSNWRGRLLPRSQRAELTMLAKWANVLPVFVVRWLALRHCERFPWYYEGRVKRMFVCALPDCYFKVEDRDSNG